jgi:hypothetical protein
LSSPHRIVAYFIVAIIGHYGRRFIDYFDQKFTGGALSSAQARGRFGDAIPACIDSVNFETEEGEGAGGKEGGGRGTNGLVEVPNPMDEGEEGIELSQLVLSGGNPRDPSSQGSVAAI